MFWEAQAGQFAGVPVSVNTATVPQNPHSILIFDYLTAALLPIFIETTGQAIILDFHEPLTPSTGTAANFLSKAILSKKHLLAMASPKLISQQETLFQLVSWARPDIFISRAAFAQDYCERHIYEVLAGVLIQLPESQDHLVVVDNYLD
jgi:hypothetical protein